MPALIIAGGWGLESGHCRCSSSTGSLEPACGLAHRAASPYAAGTRGTIRQEAIAYSRIT
ncbi:MAG: hypothetical protein MUC60_09260 [Oscillatoria sp. Prado101]|nr:hypothetical protein [Oscillatoria sp. Prado101]